MDLFALAYGVLQMYGLFSTMAVDDVVRTLNGLTYLHWAARTLYLCLPSIIYVV